jgi:hypothetical protein
LISLLLDQGLPRSAVAILTSKGYDALHVADLGLDEAKDFPVATSHTPQLYAKICSEKEKEVSDHEEYIFE